MAGDVLEINEDQLRQIISGYLEEVMHCYEEQQRLLLESGGHDCDRLEQKARELLEAMTVSVGPDERRRAILQVLCRARGHREPMPS